MTARTAPQTQQQPEMLLWTPATWSDAVEVLRGLDGWLFRGQCNARWPLATSLERVCKERQCPEPTMHQMEEEALNSFKRQAFHHLQHIPAENDNLEWLAMIQHHGGPTRLLDCTRSFYAAAFFAAESGGSDAVIWSFNQEHLDRKMMASMGKDSLCHHAPTVRRVAHQLANLSIRPTMTKADLEEEKYWAEHMPDDCRPLPVDQAAPVLAVKPWRLNQRMIIQQGWFLFPTRVEDPFEKALCRIMGLQDERLPQKQNVAKPDELRGRLRESEPGVALLKVILPRGMHDEILRDLARMNISAATLFPGLDGFARSLQVSLRLFRREGGTPE